MSGRSCPPLPSPVPAAPGTCCAYMLRCADGSLYTGWTNNLPRRLQAHQQGKGAKYTRSRLPVELVWYAVCAGKREAMRLEYSLKQLRRAEKLALVRNIQGEDSL